MTRGVKYIAMSLAIMSRVLFCHAHWPICYDYAVQDGCYKRSETTGQEKAEAGYVNWHREYVDHGGIKSLHCYASTEKSIGVTILG
jgi:hypothetical protein